MVQKEREIREIPTNKCRIIRINRTAVQEIINEFFVEHMKNLFNVSDVTDYVIETRWNPTDESYTAVLFRHSENTKGFVTDIERIEQVLNYTATSAFDRPAYQEHDLANFYSSNP